VLDFGLFRSMPGRADIGIVGFLIVTDKGERLLVDSGFPAKYAADPERATAEDWAGELGKVLVADPENLPEAQLVQAGGAGRRKCDLFLLTHSHIDHLGGLFDFPAGAPADRGAREGPAEAALLVGRAALGLAGARDDPAGRGCAAGAGLRGAAGPGHAPGQLALVVELPRTGVVVLTSDAISRPAEVEERFDTAPDPELALESARGCCGSPRSATPSSSTGMGRSSGPKLRKAPEFYD
jgi:N-acyl homoserine lactone hydrolase